MAGIIDFSQIFSDHNLQVSNKYDNRNGQSFDTVPEPPVCTDIPNLDTLFGGDGKNSLLDLQPSQWLPPSQMSKGIHPTQTRLKTSQINSEAMSERGDGDNIYLGSQYPLIHKIGPSQVPMSNSEKIWNFQSSQRLQSQAQKSQCATIQRTVPMSSSQAESSDASYMPKSMTNYLQRERRKMHQDIGFTEMIPGGNDSQEDLFEESEEVTTGGGTHLIGTHSDSKFDTPSKRATDQLCTPTFVAVPLEQYRLGVRLRPVTEISENFRKIFNFSHFNIVQSKVFDDVMYTDRSLVLCSPTGSGKTAVFELAIVRLMTTSNNNFSRNFKIVYMAPIKALCSERFSDWREKFEPYGLKVMELTGDTDTEEFYELQQVNIVLTTPEKWDSMTRKWRDNKSVMQAICLFLIDEIHVLNDPSRGPVVEAVVSRMKTIQAARQRSTVSTDLLVFRFVAISATITNIEDLAEWLGNSKRPAVHYKFDDSARPVRLRKVVLGYHFAENKQSVFQFDISLSYKLAGVINTYSEEKPTLIFCATRKSAMQGAEILSKDVKSSYVRSAQHRITLQNHSFHIKDAKLRDLLLKGIGYHHAGMDVHDRKLIEQIFRNGQLPVLVATSTLAMGVNLPAHLVIIKSTMYYNMGSHQEYPDTQVLQMIGRAGRPQFDTSATAVIMTKNITKMKYENLLNGTQLIESSLHRNLVEHLNAEIVLNTITDISVAVEWLKYTFLYIRVMKNPTHYGMPKGLSRQSIEKRLQDLCVKGLNQLHHLSLIQMNEENMDVKPTESGRLMARYCISYKTAELFLAFKGDESIADMLNIISKCEEFEDIKLRNNEKKTLNTLNKDKNRMTIRYPMTGKIKTSDMKVNCLIQATFGSLLIQDFALQQDTSRIFRAGVRVTRCLAELLSQKNNFKSLLSALLLCKCFKAKLWEDSKYVSRQLDGIGPTLSTALVNAGLTSFEKLEKANPREIELIVNRHPPFGNQVKENLARLPKYELVIEQVMRYSVNVAEIVITVQLTNRESLKKSGSTGHTCTLLVGDADNKVIYKQRVIDALLLKEMSWSKKLEVKLAEKGPELMVHYISQDWVGLDVECTYTPSYLGGKRITSSSSGGSQQLESLVASFGSGSLHQPCQHSCNNKATCGHECCKHGITLKRKRNTSQPTPKPTSTKRVANHVQEIRNKSTCLQPSPSVTKRARFQDNVNNNKIDLASFAYNPQKRKQASDTSLQGQLPAICNNDLNIYREPLALYSKNKRQNHHKFSTDLQYTPAVTKRGADWPELDMYANIRHSHSTEGEYLEEEGSLPDLDTTFDELADPGPNWHAIQNEQCLEDMKDDFAHETDYGYTYISGEDQSVLPVEWDDRVSGTWQKDAGRTNKICQKGRQLMQSKIPDRNMQLEYKASKGMRPTSRKQSISCNQTVPRQTGTLDDNKYQSDYDIEDFSDESFEAAVNGVPVSTNCRLVQVQETMPACYRQAAVHTTKENRDPAYKLNCVTQQANNDFVAKNSLNKFSRFIHNADESKSACLNNTTTGKCSRKTGVLKNWNEAILNKKSTSYRTQVENSDVENLYPELYDDYFFEDVQGNQSKWTNYFSSQSSTASNNLNWKYPAMNNNNKIVMQSCDLPLDECSQQQTVSDNETAANRCSTNVSSHGKEHKYGQVLAWVSNPENHQFSGQEEKIQKETHTGQENWTRDDGDNLKLKCATEQRRPHSGKSFFSALKSPDKVDNFIGIFEGIL